jgi:hypothetical protein
MKLGIVFTGESYGQNQGVFSGRNRDWRISKDNLKETLIDSFKQKHDVKVYLTTYDNPTLQEYLNWYQPHKYLIPEFAGSHQRTTYIKSMQMLLDEDLDFIIATRPDLSFPQPVSSLNFDYDKINFCFREIEPHWTNDQFIGDCLFGIPKKYLQSFIEGIAEEHEKPYRWHPDLHGIYRWIAPKVGTENIHFLIDGTHNSSDNSLYTLHRT